MIYSLNEIINAVSSLENDLITISPDQDFNGQIEISVAVTDGELIDTTTFNLDVLPVNDAPILEEISDKEMDENEILEIDFLANDVDGDELSYDYFIISGYAQAAISNNQIIITPNENWFGEIEVTFTVTDGEFFDQENFFIQVLEVDPPTAYDITATGEEDELIIVPLIASSLTLILMNLFFHKLALQMELR